MSFFSALASIWPYSMVLDRLAVPKHREEQLLSQIRERLKSLPLSFFTLSDSHLPNKEDLQINASCLSGESPIQA